MKKTFDIKTLFTKAVDNFKDNWGMFILIGIIFILISLLGNTGMALGYAGGFSGFSLTSILVSLLQAFIGLGYLRFLLNMAREQDHKIEDLFNGPQSFAHFAYFLVVSLLYNALTMLGIVLFIIPGIIAGIGFMFASYLVAEQKTDIFTSFKRSWEMTTGNRWKILWLSIVLVGFNILGFLAFGIGLIMTIPVTSLVYVHLYTRLESSDDTDEIEVIEVIEGDVSEEE